MYIDIPEIQGLSTTVHDVHFALDLSITEDAEVLQRTDKWGFGELKRARLTFSSFSEFPYGRNAAWSLGPHLPGTIAPWW